MIQSLSPLRVVYADRMRLPSINAASFNSRSSWSRSPQSPERCLTRNSWGVCPASRMASRAPGVATIWPGWNLALVVSFRLTLSLLNGTCGCSQLDRWCQAGWSQDQPCSGLSLLGELVLFRLAVRGVSLVLGVDPSPVFS